MSLVGREFKPLTTKIGPYICLTSISDELQNILLNVGNKIRKNKFLKQKNDYRKKLAGNLKEEYSYANAFTSNQRQKVNEELLWLVSNYTKAASQFTRKNCACEPYEIFLQEPIWVNYMKQGEWNPLHAHSGDISCVTYLKIPKEKDMIIFPAKLNHMVYPFKSKTERVSVSVNFSDMRKAKLNLGMKP